MEGNCCQHKATDLWANPRVLSPQTLNFLARNPPFCLAGTQLQTNNHAVVWRVTPCILTGSYPCTVRAGGSPRMLACAVRRVDVVLQVVQLAAFV